MTEVPRRSISDPQALRALAHPLRLRLLEELVFDGPATATELSERVGESPANCSWHLRQLARYGYVEEAGGGAGRQRPWRYVNEMKRFEDGEEGSELAIAEDASFDILLARELEQLRAYLPASRRERKDWREAAFLVQSMLWMTVDELAEANRQVQEIYTKYVDRIGDPTLRPDGSRPIRLMAWGFPARPVSPEQ